MKHLLYLVAQPSYPIGREHARRKIAQRLERPIFKYTDIDRIGAVQRATETRASNQVLVRPNSRPPGNVVRKEI